MTGERVETTAVSQAELAVFTRQLGAMLAANVNVLRALRIAGHQCGNARLMETSRDIGNRLGDGREFHQAIAAFPDLFDAFYVEMARQGEMDGNLGASLVAVADHLDHPVARARQRTVSASPGAPALTMATLGVLAMGAAVVWAISAVNLLPIVWTAPLAFFWAGFCLLAGAWLLKRIHPAGPDAQASARPIKTPERRTAETEGVVRNAVMEEQEAEEERGLQAQRLEAEEARAKAGRNGSHPTSVQPAADAEDDGTRFKL